MIKDAVASMDLGQKILLYESMKKNVGLITLISIFIPGGGQIYLGEYLKGLLILLLAWLVLPWLYGIYDAHTTASGFNRELHDLIYRAGGVGKGRVFFSRPPLQLAILLSRSFGTGCSWGWAQLDPSPLTGLFDRPI